MSLTHSDLTGLVKSGDQDAFIALSSDFSGLIRRVIASYEVDNSEQDDLYQEGLIGLYKAALAYQPSLNASFSTFARICIKHSIVSALRIYYGKKNFPIRSSVSLDSDNGELTEVYGLGPVTEPEQLLIEKESYDALLSNIDIKLSPLERDVLKLFVQGNSYGEISKRLQMSSKSVDNAIQRIRGKLKLFIQT